MGGLLSLSSEYGFVLEDDEGICGYALGTVDVKPFVKKCKLSWIPFMQEKYSKPDCQKDLTEAEVSFCSGVTGLRDMNRIHILMFGLLFCYFDAASMFPCFDLACFLFPAEDDAEFP